MSNLSDEFYTPRWLVEALYKEFDPEKVLLLFDGPKSMFVKFAPTDFRCSDSDFFAIPDEELIYYRDLGYVVFTNPPFSRMKEIVTRLRRLNLPYYLIAHGLYWRGLVDPGDSVYYCGYVRYETPRDLRPTQRTVVIANDGHGTYKKCLFVPLYTKPYRGKKNLDWSDTPKSLGLWDTHLYAIRGYELDLTKYQFEGTRLVRCE